MEKLKYPYFNFILFILWIGNGALLLFLDLRNNLESWSELETLLGGKFGWDATFFKKIAQMS